MVFSAHGHIIAKGCPSPKRLSNRNPGRWSAIKNLYEHLRRGHTGHYTFRHTVDRAAAGSCRSA